MTKSPTIRLLLGLLITLGAVAGFCWYSLYQLESLRKLQHETIDLNRHDSLLLLRVQDDLNRVGLKLRDMTQMPHTLGIARYRDAFGALRADLQQALQSEARLRPTTRSQQAKAKLRSALDQFWQTSDQVFAEATSGNESSARTLVSTKLSAEQSALATRVSDQLERNTKAEEVADQQVASIYNGDERNIYAFLAATILAILVTSLYLIYSNRQIFEKLESLSRQRRVLAARLITVQEEVLRSVSRELHDEFGQILTAVSAMLSRAERKGLPPDSPFRTELTEVREITHSTIEKMRSLSQMLHPAVLDDYGLAKGIEWYTEVFQRQTGIHTDAIIRGTAPRITGQSAIHCFRIVQEALNNAAKHSGTRRAEIEMVFSSETLTIHIRDFGCGMTPAKKKSKPGLGLIAMRERAELLSGTLNVVSAPGVGTTVSLTMPLRQDDTVAEALQQQESMGEVVNWKS
jgi:signal transduction histidine kinase